ncbi:hypothetical protein RD792_004486 [Penstemon davidsonii]|uniref:Response regulatory domain-containing protein n=1 Tax=Penstemon davidsonii TaxID=160366 RepID=A0ABR0DHK7_9LAMI|nr:hypothetical protein RD792_004486 [Penstemon davidsonii]
MTPALHGGITASAALVRAETCRSRLKINFTRPLEEIVVFCSGMINGDRNTVKCPLICVLVVRMVEQAEEMKQNNNMFASLRVLLVEADDSTHHTISALLRKCSYQVAAVSDGLNAWETLKGRFQNRDLILTEADLPSISGYALLSLVMEHDICKNIPVLMMSSKDSISIVLKCMLRGAADFLTKPVRKNELRNLWQHIWRRQTMFKQDMFLLKRHVPESIGRVAESSGRITKMNSGGCGLLSLIHNYLSFLLDGEDESVKY